jgi:hypothetical protein
VTIRSRLALSFLTILLLFATNIGVYYWGGQQKKRSLLEIRQALTQAQLLAVIDRTLDERRKEVGVFAQLADSGAGALTPEQVSALGKRLDAVSEQIVQLRRLSDTGFAQQVDVLQRMYGQLRTGWQQKYESSSTHPRLVLFRLWTGQTWSYSAKR